jgi:RNA polymerase sigma factor (sigma-70 family)
MTTDSELLRQFAQTNSEAAFAELVKRHVNLVYSAALRQVNGDTHLAQDVAQTVFTDLARKAGSFADRKNLTGWLYTSAHFAAAKLVRGETRRREREQQFMREPTNESETGFQPVQSAPSAEWETLRPMLDAAMHALKETDREAILLRYFENLPFIQVGAKLGLNENAARMRVERALEKLRGVLTKRGLATTATFAAVISANAVQLAPAGLAATLATVSIVTAGTGTLTLMKIMTMTKLKFAVSALVVAGAATALVVQHQTQNKLCDKNADLQQQIAQLQIDSEGFSNRLAAAGDAKKISDEQFNELLKLRGEVGVLRRQLDEAGKLSEENQRLREAATKLQSSNTSLEMASAAARFKVNEIQVVNTLKQLGLGERIYAAANGDQYATNFDQMANELGGLYNSPLLTNIDFVNVGTVNEQSPWMILFRERQARQAADGTWHRVYGLADGSVQTASSPDGSFNAWEKYDNNEKGVIFLPPQYPSR